MLALRDALDGDLAANGTSNRKGEPRRQIDLRLRVSRHIEKWTTHVERDQAMGRNGYDNTGESEGGDATEPEQQRRERYEELKKIAFGERLDVSAPQRIRAIRPHVVM